MLRQICRVSSPVVRSLHRNYATQMHGTTILTVRKGERAQQSMFFDAVFKCNLRQSSGSSRRYGIGKPIFNKRFRWFSAVFQFCRRFLKKIRWTSDVGSSNCQTQCKKSEKNWNGCDYRCVLRWSKVVFCLKSNEISSGNRLGFAGGTADAMTLFERLEQKLDEHKGVH